MQQDIKDSEIIFDPENVGQFDESLPDAPDPKDLGREQAMEVLEAVERVVSKAHEGLVPYQIMVYPKTGAKPYTTTRWKHPQAGGASPVHVIPAASYMGNLFEVSRAWQSLIARSGEATDALLRPVVALQEILLQGRAGILAVQDNRVVGVATLQQGDDFVSASPMDQLQGREGLIEHVLAEGLRAYEMTDE